MRWHYIRPDEVIHNHQQQGVHLSMHNLDCVASSGRLSSAECSVPEHVWRWTHPDNPARSCALGALMHLAGCRWWPVPGFALL